MFELIFIALTPGAQGVALQRDASARAHRDGVILERAEGDGLGGFLHVGDEMDDALDAVQLELQNPGPGPVGARPGRVVAVVLFEQGGEFGFDGGDV